MALASDPVVVSDRSSLKSRRNNRCVAIISFVPRIKLQLLLFVVVAAASFLSTISSDFRHSIFVVAFSSSASRSSIRRSTRRARMMISSNNILGHGAKCMKYHGDSSSKMHIVKRGVHASCCFAGSSAPFENNNSHVKKRTGFSPYSYYLQPRSSRAPSSILLRMASSSQPKRAFDFADGGSTSSTVFLHWKLATSRKNVHLLHAALSNNDDFDFDEQFHNQEDMNNNNIDIDNSLNNNKTIIFIDTNKNNNNSTFFPHQNKTDNNNKTTPIQSNKHHKRPRIPILSYKNHYVILSKPSGMTMHHNSNSRWGRSKSPVLQTTIHKQLSRKPYLVHRLDHRTSGAVLMGFDSESAGILHGRLRGEGSVKGYIALVRGDLRKKFQNAAEGRSDSSTTTMVTTTSIMDRNTLFGRDGPVDHYELKESEYYGKITVDLPIKVDGVEKDAKTDFYFLASMDYQEEDDELDEKQNHDKSSSYTTKSLSLLLCRPRTGRTHQIRRHVQKALQSPIIGDSEHGDSRVNRFWRETIGLDRLGLHCWYLDLPEVVGNSYERDDDLYDSNGGEEDGDRDGAKEDTTASQSTSSLSDELKERIQIIAPLPPDLSSALQSERLKPLWEEAIRVEPRLTMEPYDERGGTFGRHYRQRRGNNNNDDIDSVVANGGSSATKNIIAKGFKWVGSSMSQDDMMERDTLLIVDENDLVIGSESKRVGHIFSPIQPRGILHRAFSVFIFDEQSGELLLQKRASTKITFPNVWTNTCCSHQLHGMDINEVDDPESVKNGSVEGAKAAAVRKLEHELGIPLGEIKLEQFKFLTRVHYWASDTITHGKQSPWGEHEIDYILFATVPSKEAITIKPNADEVDDFRWVSQKDLLEMFEDKTLLFSPWFRIIANRWMIGKNIGGKNSSHCDAGWWDDLNRTMNTSDFCDYDNIHRFDPPTEHLGGAGDAGPLYERVNQV